jgi:hypothetical protein
MLYQNGKRIPAPPSNARTVNTRYWKVMDALKALEQARIAKAAEAPMLARDYYR